MTNKKILRQGDILLKEVDRIPTSALDLSTDILAFGEKTGHHHKLQGSFQLYQTVENGNETKYLEILEETKLVHQEHNRIQIPRGMYVVVNERQYNPFKNIKVRVERVID